jgi:hypothetical protein
MTYYRKQRMESCMRAVFAARLNSETASTEMRRSEDAREVRAIVIPGVLTGATLAAGQLAS